MPTQGVLARRVSGIGIQPAKEYRVVIMEQCAIRNDTPDAGERNLPSPPLVHPPNSVPGPRSLFWSTAVTARRRTLSQGRDSSYLCEATYMKDRNGAQKTGAINPQVKASTEEAPHPPRSQAKRRTKRLRRRLNVYKGLPRVPRHLRPVHLTAGMVSLDVAELLYSLARTVDNGVIVEVGSYRGRSTVALALGSRAGHGVPVFAIEPHETFHGPLGGDFGPEDRGFFYRAMLRSECYREVRLVNLSSEQVAPCWNRPIGMLWIDGDHATESVRRDLAQWRPHVVSGGLVVFDDCYGTSRGAGAVVAEEVNAGRLAVENVVGRVMATRISKPTR
jgi:hypothetical protein